MASHLSTSPATFENQRIIAIFTKLLALTSCLIQRGGNQMHLTYASPGPAEYYRRNKKFADGEDTRIKNAIDRLGKTV